MGPFASSGCNQGQKPKGTGKKESEKKSKKATLQIAATSPFPLVVMEENCDVTDLPPGVTGHKGGGMLEQHVHSRT